MQFLLRDSHFHQFKMLSQIENDWAGRNPQQWAAKIGVDHSTVCDLPDGKVDRELLKSMCADKANSSECCLLTIMAWGGMKCSHGRMIWRYRDKLKPIVDHLRRGNMTRQVAYETLRNFRLNAPGSGMGPAYYTKLIYFAAPMHDGYIMDQWTASAVNILFDNGNRPVVWTSRSEFRGRRTDTVSDRNTGDTYEIFCRSIEYLSDRIYEASAEDVEKRLFSRGGRFPGAWRQYVKAHRQ